MTSVQTCDYDSEICQVRETISKIKHTMSDVILYVSKRAEMTFSQLRMNRVEISLYDVVKSTGEARDTFKFTYNGRRYDRLLSFGKDPGWHGGVRTGEAADWSELPRLCG